MIFFNSAGRLVLVFCILLLMACNSAKKDNPALKEAADTHQQALQIEKQVRPQLEELIHIKNNINVQGRALTPEEQALVQEIESLESSYNYWEENHVEVPGYEHDHEGHNHEGHDHGAKKLELTPQDMIVVQREFRDSILSIQQRVEETLQKAKQTSKE